MKKNIFMMIRKAKARTAKKILKGWGNPFDKMARFLTSDELVKFFNFLEKNAEIYDSEEGDIGTFQGYQNDCIELKLLSPESVHRIREEVMDDFFPEKYFIRQ